MDTNNLVSDEYRALLEYEHLENKDLWGTTAQNMLHIIEPYLKRVNATKFLDYGAGHGGLKKVWGHKYKITEYEPGRPEVSAPPEPHDMVLCIDVLEHIEPEYIDNVLKDLQRVTKEYGLFQIATRPAVKKLKDGRNAHLIVKPAQWWIEKVNTLFEIVDFQTNGTREVRVFVKAL